MINEKDFVGKTIERMNTTAVNEVKFYFTDGTEVALETVCELPSLGLYGITQVGSGKTSFADDVL
jgi:hypothetical protein